MKFTHTSTSGLFEGCDTIEAVKRRYHELARTMHPDCGGDAEAFKALSAEYTARFDVFRDIHEARDGHVYKAEEESTERPEQYKEAIDAVIGIAGLDIEIVGSWVWVTGSTMIHREALKAAGYRWSGSKKAWYYTGSSTSSKRKHRGYCRDMDAVRAKWGTSKIKPFPALEDKAQA